MIVKPTAPLEMWLQVRGRHVGTQYEWRTRYRFTSHVDFDGGLTVRERSLTGPCAFAYHSGLPGMLGSRSRTSVAVTLLVGVATLVALALPEGIGGRDSVVRLTRGGLQRIGCPDTAAYGHDDPESFLDVPADSHAGTVRLDGPPLATLIVSMALAVAPVPAWQVFVPSWPALLARPAVPPGFAVAGRAPPAL